MHIVYVTPEFVTESKGGGLATYLSNISRILVSHGNRVTVVTASEINDDAIMWERGITVERVKKPSGKLLVPIKILLQSWKLHQRVKRISKKTIIDIVQYASFEAVGFFHLRRVPGVVRISSDCVSWREYKIYDYMSNDLTKFSLTDKIEYYTDKSVQNIYAPSYATAALVSNRIHRSIPVIESPFYMDKSGYDYSLYKDKLEGKKYFLAYSSMSCLKGTHVIAEVICKVCENDSQVYFVFAGSDHGIFYRDGKKISGEEYIKRCAGQYADRVIFLGTLRRNILYPIIEKSFACLMPSRIDNMPNTCIEAMALGKIVIGTRGASFEQLIEDGISGYLIEIDNSEELVQKIEVVRNLDARERKKIGINAQLVTERFDPDNIYKQVIRYYTNIIKADYR